MMSQSPRWPDEPARPHQSRGGGSPLARLARSQRDLTVIAMVTGLLIVALLGMLALALSSNAHGAQAKNGQSGQTQSGQAAYAGNAQTATADGGGNGASSGGDTSTPGGGSSGGGGTHPTPTPSHGSATPTPTSGIATGGCCLTFTPAVHQVVSQTILSGTRVGPAYASCPSGETALSGGWAIPPDPGDNVFRSQRAGAGNWAVYVKHASSITVKTYAECLANASGATIAERLAQVSIPDGVWESGAAIATCNAGETLVGGGFASQDYAEIAASDMSSGGWKAFAWNHGSSSALLNAYAECLTYGKAHSSYAKTQTGTPIARDAMGSAASPICPSGTYVSGGGYSYQDESLLYAMSATGSGSSASWTVSLRVNGDFQLLFSHVMCLGF